MHHRSTDGHYSRAIIIAHKCRTKHLYEHQAKYFTYIIFHFLSQVFLLDPLTDKEPEILIDVIRHVVVEEDINPSH